MRRTHIRTLAIVAAATAAAAPFAFASAGDERPEDTLIRLERALRPSAVGQVDRGTQIPRHRYGSVFAGPEVSSGTWEGAGNGTFYGFDTDLGTAEKWNVAGNWTGNIPGSGGGTAFIGRPGALGDVERQDSVSPVLDINVTLNTLQFDNELASGVLGTTNTITTAAAGLTVRNDNGLNIPFTRSFVFSDGSRIYPKISGSGAVTVTGAKPVVFANTMDFSGGLTVNGGGVLIADEVAADAPNDEPGIPFVNDGHLGTGTVVLDGGELWFVSSLQTPSVYNITKNIHIGAGGGTLLTAGAQASFNNTFSGPGDLNLIFPTAKTFTKDNTFTGALRIGTGSAILSGADGRMSGTQQIFIDGLLTVDNSSDGNADRLSDTTTVNLKSAKIRLVGPIAADLTETIGTLAIAGNSTASVQTDFGQTTTFDIGTLARGGRGSVLLRGEKLGDAGAESSRILLGNGAGLLVGGGAAATEKAIIPFASGATYAVGAMPGESAVAASVQIGNATLVSYDGVRGVVPLDLDTDYVENFGAGLSPLSNVKVEAATSVGAPTTINALVMGSTTNGNLATGSPLSGAGAITITSGVILNNAGGSTIANPIDFGAAEGVVVTHTAAAGSAVAGTNGLRLDGVVSGTNGLTKVGAGNLYLYGANTYTGETTIVGGRTIIRDSVNAGVAGPFGADSSPVRFVAGSAAHDNVPGFDTTRLFTSGTLTFNREVSFEGSGVGGIQIGALAGGALTFTQPVSITTTDDVVLSGIIRFNGAISGDGNMADVAGASITFAADNSAWSGGFEFQGTSGNTTPTTIGLAADNALGTGPLFFSGPTRFNATGVSEGGRRVISNPISLDPSDSGYISFSGPVEISGDIKGASFTRTWVALGDGDVLISGDILDSGMSLIGSGTLNLGSGTFTLAGNNNNNGRINVGGAGTASGIAPNPIYVKIASNGALGEAGMEMTQLGSTIELTGGINLPNRNIFIRGAGRSAVGALLSSGADNSTLGSVILANNGTVGIGTSVINVASGNTLTVGDYLRDITGDPDATPTPIPDGGELWKRGDGTLTVRALADADLDTNGDDVLVALNRSVLEQGVIKVAPGGTDASTSIVKNYFQSPGTALDITDNGIAVTGTETVLGDVNGFGTLANAIRSGYNGGAWTGAGIRSSLADSSIRGLGYATASDVLTFPAAEATTTWRGVTVSETAALILYTFYGDTNLDGQVDVTDLGNLASGFLSSGAWINGDFDYTGFVDVADLGALATNWQAGVTGPAAPSASFSAALASVGLSVVPEPTSLSLIGLAALALGRRQRRSVKVS